MRVGLEHEYVVRRDGETIDFRALIHHLGLEGEALDPGDHYAHRMPGGVVITCDDREAEVSTPPVPLGSDFVVDLDAWVAAATGSLVSRCAGLELEGCSTHFSVSAAESGAVRAAGLMARTFAPALMLMMDNTTSDGLLVRPRYERIEVGGDFVTGPGCRSTALMAAGAVLTCLAVARRERPKSHLPPAVRVEIVPAQGRYGWYIDRRAFGPDLYERGRAAVLRRELWGRISAQDHLEAAWRIARRELLRVGVVDGLDEVDEIVAGRAPLPCEEPPDRHPPASGRPPSVDSLARAAAPIARPGLRLVPVAATWDYVVWEASVGGLVAVPVAELGEFLDRVRGGLLDEELRAGLAGATRELVTFWDAVAGGFFAAVADDANLATPERVADGTLALTPRSPIVGRRSAGVG